VFAVAGIGDPEQFFASLRRAEWNVVGSRAFRDHHRYSRRELTEIGDAARAAGADIVVTTAKDAVRLEAAGEAPFRWSAVALTLALDPAAAFLASIDAALRRAREAA
jgi:tetraacyldisaccharide 4'-kinase